MSGIRHAMERQWAAAGVGHSLRLSRWEAGGPGLRFNGGGRLVHFKGRRRRLWRRSEPRAVSKTLERQAHAI